MPTAPEFILYVFAALLAAGISVELNKIIRQIHLLLCISVTAVSFYSGYIAAGIFCFGILAGDIYILSGIMNKNDLYSILQVRGSNEYLGAFIEYYKREIYHFSPFYKRNPDSTCFLILNNIEVIGIFIVTVHDRKTLYIDLDFVIPSYRNNTVGKFLFYDNIGFFKDLGYDKIQTVCLNKYHEKYLLKMGFQEREIKGERLFVKDLVS